MKKRILTTTLIISIALIIAGSALSWNAFSLYESTILYEQDSKLYEIANTTDINVKNVYASIGENANKSILKSEKIKKLQDAADLTKDYGTLKTSITKSSLSRNDLVLKIICRKGKKILFVTDNTKGYSFPKDNGDDRCRLCKDGDGTFYFAYECKLGEYIYDVIIDPNELYSQIITEGKNIEIRRMLVDVDSDVVIYRVNDEILVENSSSVSDVRESEFEFIQECQKSGEAYGVSFERVFKDGETASTARMVAVPSIETQNGVFAIGILTNYDSTMAPLRKAIRKMTLYMLLAAFGITLLVVCIVLMRRETIVQSIELKELQEKNAAMTELNQQMQALSHHQRLETIGTMTSSIAHEFNNLLTPIMGYSMMALEELPEDSEIYENLIEIYDSSRKAKEVIERLAEITRKGDNLSFKKVEINKIAEKAIAATRPIHREDVKIVFVKSKEGIYVNGDETQLQQLLMNLILNAHHAIEGVGTITVSTFAEYDRAIIKVEDTGMGISKDALAHIFDPFYTTKESGKGTGLGLAIATQITENHKGKIYVESKEDEGTTFTISLPIEG